MSELDKVLEWVEKNKRYDDYTFQVNAEVLIGFINELKNPPKKLTWHMRTKDNPEWKAATDDEHEVGQYLSRFEWQQFEL